MDPDGGAQSRSAQHRQQGPPSLREFGLQAWHNRKSALLIACGVFGASLTIAALVPAHYKAVATLAVLPAPEFTVRPDAGSRDQAATTLALDQVMKAETEILDSDNLHLAVLTTLGTESIYPGSASADPKTTFGRFAHHLSAQVLSFWIAPPTDGWAGRVEQQLRRFRGDLLVLPAKDSNIVTVSFASKSPNEAASVVNTLLALYAIRRKELYDDPQLDAIRREKLALEVQAAEADQRLMEFKRKLKISDFASQRALLLQRLSGAEQALADARSLVSEQSARVGLLAQQINHEPATQAIFEERDPDTRLQLAKSALQDLEAHSAEMAERYTPGSRLLDRLRKQVDARRVALNAMQKDGRSSVARDGRNVNLDQMRLDLQRGLTDLVATRSRLNSVTLQCRILDAGLQSFDQVENALHKLEREKASAEENLVGMNRLLSERHLTEAEDALRFANVRVIQPARIPQAATPVPIYITAGGFPLGIISAGAAVTFLFIRRDVFLTADGLAEHFQIPVFATFSLEEMMFEKEFGG